MGELQGVRHAAVNPLARPLVEDRLTDEEQAQLAAAAIAPLAEAWRDDQGDFPSDPRRVEAARLALMGSAPQQYSNRRPIRRGPTCFTTSTMPRRPWMSCGFL